MAKKTAILWPSIEPPDIFEIRYGYEFCREQSRALCHAPDLKTEWLNYCDSDTIGHAFKNLPGVYHILLVTDPLIVLNVFAVRTLLGAVEAGLSAAGPLFNETRFIHQQAVLRGLYHNMTSYLEVSARFADDAGDTTPVEQLDPGCLMFTKDALDSNCDNILIRNAHQHFTGDKGIANGAMMHRFSNAFESAREDLVAMVPDHVVRVLDVGTAFGGYGKRLKEDRSDIFVAGIELNPAMAEFARQYYDEVFNHSIEDFEPPYSVDLINCGELLEHLDNPWAALGRFSRILTEGGYLTLSVPNAGHWSIILDLINGRFQYIPMGLQCITHIRWFTEHEIQNSLAKAGFAIDMLKRVQSAPTESGQRFIQDLTEKGYGDRDQLMTTEIVIRARKK